MSDSFEDAVAGVQSKQGGNEYAEVVFEKREYPLIPEGQYKAICCKSELRESRSEFDDPGTMKICLRWQVWEPMYKGDDDKEHHYIVFAKPLGIAFGERANLPKVFKKLTGLEPMVQKIHTKIDIGGGKFKEATRMRFDHKVFENMECELIVSHKEYEGKMYPQIENIICMKEMREKNAAQLPAEYRLGSSPVPQHAEGPALAAKNSGVQVAPEPAPSLSGIGPSAEENEKMKQEARDRGFPID